MSLMVTLYAALDDDTIVAVDRHRLAASPDLPERTSLVFGRRSRELAKAAAGRPTLAIDDDWVSRDQGTIDWTSSEVVVTNHSAARKLSVRSWGTPRVTLGEWQDSTVRGARAVVDILDTTAYLVIGPADPHEPGWEPSFRRGEGTPSTEGIARDRLRPALLCRCRLHGAPATSCRERSHRTDEKQLLALLASASAFASWPQGRDAASGRRGTRGLVAGRLGYSISDLSKQSKGFRERVHATVESPEQDESDLFLWLVERGVLTFDELADLIKVISA
ncbi:hypothetical protein [Nocardioides zhouii]|uniref:Uncharacterized protein n=1 Tax=Nocardioides zhouii TaxID=1168729 RepID=A0A4Q2SNG1_9ACTN|nr:hypothetical protein [Nocardioides zhouii]RYC05734.1 hypothetical protein EUA94_17695 [Nocardioides zhouii]